DWFTVFMGDNALMENCTVEGELRINNGENMQISNSVITGAVHGSDFTGTIIDTEFNTTRSSRFESSEIDFRGCVFNGFFRFSPICMNIDRCRFYGKVSINSTDRNDEETVTINRCLIIGFTSLIRIIDNFYFTNNTVLYDSCGNQDTWEPLFSFQLEEPYECQIFNNLLIAAQDSCQLFKFIMDTTFPEVSYNCIYGFDYILHSSNRSQNTPFTLNETNILSNPRLMSVENQDFTLDWNSPCIDAGDPNSPLDPDSTRADIGAFYRDRNMYVSRNVESITNCMESLSFYPNPFNSSININFALPFCSFTAISITDLSGRNVATLLNERIPTGTHHGNWDAVNYPAGVYFVKMNCNGKSMLKKIVLIE
ncbi:T9SS type A sorting domain-containing protein, partial [bacterium]|nr:T9SS type A sorting domain-containing protein [bacterium]